MSAMRGRLGAYSLWQLRDYALTTSGLGTLLIPFVLGVFPLLITKYVATKAGASAAEAQNAYLGAFMLFVAIFATVGPMLTVAQVVSADRQPGLTRFVFSKPVNVSAYYLQAWLVRGAGLMAIALLLTQVVNQFVAPVPWREALGAVAVAWVLIGGLGFLLSVLFARDIAVLLILFLGVTTLDSLRQNVPTATWVKPVLAVMPPFHRLDEIRDALLRGTPMPSAELWHALIFGAACVALATYLVRRLPLVR